VFTRLNMLRRLQEIDIESPEEAMALLERVTMNTSSAQDRERLAHLIRVTAQVTDQLLRFRPSLPRSGLQPGPKANGSVS
jgi:hypothetical protein